LSREQGKARGVNALMMVVHHPKIPEAGDFAPLVKGVTATPMAVHRP
jgi:hypothetical protein